MPIPLVSCADKLHNARAIALDLRTHGPAMLGRFNAPPGGTAWYYQTGRGVRPAHAGSTGTGVGPGDRRANETGFPLIVPTRRFPHRGRRRQHFLSTPGKEDHVSLSTVSFNTEANTTSV